MLVYSKKLVLYQTIGKILQLLEALKIIREKCYKLYSHNNDYEHVLVKGGYITIDEMLNAKFLNKSIKSLK